MINTHLFVEKLILKDPVEGKRCHEIIVLLEFVLQLVKFTINFELPNMFGPINQCFSYCGSRLFGGLRGMFFFDITFLSALRKF